MAFAAPLRSALTDRSADHVDADDLLRLRALIRPGRALPRDVTTLPGGFVVRRRGRGLEVDDIRTYADGDDIRHIDRNTTARTGIPHVRTYRDERERTVLLVVDLRPNMLWGTRRCLRSVAACEIAAIAGWRAIGVGGRVGLVAFGAGDPLVVPARGRDRGMIAVVGGLAAAHAAALNAPNAPVPPLARALELAGRIAPRGASVLVISGFDDLGEDFDAALGALARRTRVAALLTADAFDLQPPPGIYPYARAGHAPDVGRVAARDTQTAETIDWIADHAGIRLIRLAFAEGPEALLAQLEHLDAGQA